MFDQLVQMMEAALGRDDLFALSAKIMKKMFDALVAEGFSEEQAVKIVAGQGGLKMG